MLFGFQVRLDRLLQVTGFSVQPVNWTGDAPCMRVEARGCLPGVFRCYYSASQYGDQCFYRFVKHVSNIYNRPLPTPTFLIPVKSL